MKYQKKPNMIAADMDGETVMMDITAGKYYNLGEVGGSIWKLLDEAMSLDELVAALQAEYDVDATQCRNDVLPFLQQLVEKGLVDTIA